MVDSTVYSVIVLGGGMAGAISAETLARRGQRVLLLEQYEPGHQRGSSHGDGRIIRYAYAEPEYVAMAHLAYPLWEALGRRAGEPLIRRTGGWDCDEAGSAQLAQTEANFVTYGVPYERLDAAASNRRFPHFFLPEGSQALYHPAGGGVFADKAVLAFWRLAQAAGAETQTGERMVNLEVVGDLVHLRGASGAVYRGERLIVATGSWSRQVLRQVGLDVPLTALQVQVAHFPVLGTLSHGPEAMPYFIDYHGEHLFYGLPQLEVPGVKVGWHSAYRELADPYSEQPIDLDNLALTQRFVRERLPHLGLEPLRTTTCRYTMTPDEHFVLDRHPTLPQIVIGTGFSGHGFKFAPALGEILADLVLDQPPQLDLRRFALSRFGSTPAD